jgi:transcriptional regulator with XRE-family HTH domain
MPRSGTAYPVDDTLRRRVQQRLDEKGWKRADLARAVKCARGTITQLMNGTVNQSPLVPDILTALDLTLQESSVASEDAEELLRLFDRLSDKAKGRLLERAAQLAEQETEKRR